MIGVGVCVSLQVRGMLIEEVQVGTRILLSQSLQSFTATWEGGMTMTRTIDRTRSLWMTRRCLV